MNNVFIAVESLAALIILILIFANVYEMKENSAKKSLFTRLLIANEIVVVVDAITWLKFDWKRYPHLLAALIVVTYITPAVMQILFSLYIYEHISLKAEVNKKPFNFIVYFSAVEGIVTAVLCLTGKLFSIQDGKFYEGPLGHFYYLLNILNVILLVNLIVFNSRKLSLHDMLAALTFCVVPVVSIMTTVVTGLNFSITLLSVSMLIMYVMLQSEYESLLFRRANVDELTGLLNRAAYEDEVTKYQDLRQYPNLVYASVDVNGLKRVNDTLGHVAGDELICGAADCLKSVFGKYGKVFRTGGDEFVSIFFADEGQLAAVIELFEATVQEWKGNLVDSLTVSLGFAAPVEFPDEPLVELAKIADSRMYDSKRNFYSNTGTDRRSQNDAHRVLCALYTKILKINITEDSFSIINMNVEEQKKEKGYAHRISEWLEGFGKTGQVHPEDLEEYLAKTRLDYMSEYFKSGKASLIILYRRKYDGDVFKLVMMELIPTDEYSDNNQSLYLYVKNIDG